MAVGGFGSTDFRIAGTSVADEREPSNRMMDQRGQRGVPVHEAAGGIRCRQIAHADLAMIADLLHVGFPSKSRECLMGALKCLGARTPPEGFPQFGYMLESGHDAVGVLLNICATIVERGRRFVRCNVACWYVVPRFRLYAPLLLKRTSEHSDITHINISPAESTLQTITAQGFGQFCGGSFAGLPALKIQFGRAKISRVFDAPSLAANEQNILRDHESYGCISLVCQTTDGSYPFVFRRRAFRRFPVPGAQLIYCRDLEDLRRFAGPIGRYLALRGMPWMLIGADGPIAGVPGKYLPGRFAMYFRGPDRPRLGDLAYTEAAMFGF